MTNYNERLDKALERLAVAGRGWGVSKDTQIASMISDLAEAKQAITSLYKELVAEAKPDNQNGEMVYSNCGDGYDSGIDQFEQNLLKALEKKNASGLILKIALTVGAGMLFEGLNSIVKDSADIVVLSLTIVTRVIVFLYPAVSAWQNIYVVSGERFPPKAWMDRMNKFNENLNVKELTDEKNN